MNGDTSVSVSVQTLGIKEESDVWSKENVLTLLDRIKSLIPAGDCMKYKTTESHFDWDRVTFGEFAAEDCRLKWLKLSCEIRKYRTLTELITDAMEYVKNPYKGKKLKTHPDFPKKALTPYFRFFMEKRAKYAKIHPEMSNLDLTKILSKKYRELPEKKKLKYVEDFKQEKEQFEHAMAKFRIKHPELLEVQKKSDIPEKPKTPQQLWYNHEKKAFLKLHPEQVSLKELKDALRKQWSQLSDKKRLKWISKALELQKDYEATLKVYIEAHPDSTLDEPVKSVLTKAERQLKDKFDGRPTKPPPNGYSLYCAELMVNMKDVPSTERMVLCSKQWKVMSQKEKDMYQKRCEQRKKLYESEIQRFLESLPDEERERVLLEEKLGGRLSNSTIAGAQTSSPLRAKISPTLPESPTSKRAPERPKQPISAMFLFFQEKRKDNPELSESELTRQLARMWNDLSEKKREKYKKMERALKAEHEQKMQSFLKEKKDVGGKKKPRLPETPKTAEEMWQRSVVSEYLVRCKNDSRKAQAAMEMAWSALDKKQKIPWIKKAANDQKRYERELTEIRSPVTAQSQKKMKFDGEPKKPPMSGYQMFSQELLTNGELTHFGLKERMVEIGRRWQKQSQAQKDGYKKLVEEQQLEYKADLEVWLKSLSTQERAVYKEYTTAKRKGSGKALGPPAKVNVLSQVEESDSSDSEDEAEKSAESESNDDEEEDSSGSSESGTDEDGENEDEEDAEEDEEEDEEDQSDGSSSSSEGSSGSESD
ncbi:upstream binding transcription factor, like isoform X1 [Callorhinchus milii]|uniref:Nucleolar transcription factor 1-like protein n=1 Tax=Callorhinchus milii TaxID=7868 RepID=V9KEU9_CALMI|nr:upstream binding transcription factor, like isoform X1 [Callorhinchus milii]|eukprot:gi/632984025/ref/XP_007908936.1/ PREDICTED: nucleolar transcription factor 1-like isoform X1 [Callorhinchus milii]